jgi:putative heme transporter
MVSRRKGSEPWWRSRTTKTVVSIATILAVFGFLLPRVAKYGDVWNTVRSLTGAEIALLTAVALWNLVSYWPLLMAVLPGLRLREAAVSNLASTAVANTVPGGAALGIGVTVAMLRSWGFDTPAIALGAVLSGVWNNFWKLGLPVVALGLLGLTGAAQPALGAAAAIGVATLVVSVAVFVMIVRSDALAARLGGVADAIVRRVRGSKRGRRTTFRKRAVEFRERVEAVIRARWIAISVATAVSHISLYLVLLVALRVVGVGEHDVSAIEVLAAFAFVRLLSAIPITPGGVGVAELGLTVALAHGLPGAMHGRVAAAVLLFRALTWFVPIPLGIGCYAFWRTNTSWRSNARRSVRVASTRGGRGRRLAPAGSRS